MVRMSDVKYYPSEGGVVEIELPRGMHHSAYETAMRHVADIPSAARLEVTIDERASMGPGKEVVFHHSRVAITHVE